MRNPVRLKNLRLRFLPYYALGALLIATAPPRSAGFGAGLAIVGLGGALRTWGAGHLVKNRRFTQSGPYAWIRHPLYLGTLLVAAGFAAMLGGWLAGLALLGFLVWFGFVYFPRKDRAEGARLLERYGSTYAEYRAAVPALIPRRLPWRPALEERDSGSQPVPERWSFEHYSDNNELGTSLALLAGIALLCARELVVV